MKNLFYTFVIVLFAFSCTKDTNSLLFGFAEEFYLSEGETETAIDEKKVEFFKKNCAPAGTDLALNKIVSNNYQIFFSISPSMSSDNIIKSLESDDHFDLKFNQKYSDPSNECHGFFAKNITDYFLNINIYQDTKTGADYYIAALSTDSLKIYEVFSKNEIIGRIKRFAKN